VNQGRDQSVPRLIYITHQQPEILAARTHVLSLENSRVAFAGRREEDPKGS